MNSFPSRVRYVQKFPENSILGFVVVASVFALGTPVGPYSTIPPKLLSRIALSLFQQLSEATHGQSPFCVCPDELRLLFRAFCASQKRTVRNQR
jgi:hypothetical protein